MKNGFTITEVVIAMAILATGVFALLGVNSMANKESMDVYFEDLAFSLAREPIEVFRGFGYEFVKSIKDGNTELKEYPLGSISLEYLVGNPDARIDYPAEAANFERHIEITDAGATPVPALNVRVTVTLRDQGGKSRAEAWLTRPKISLDAIILEQRF